MTKTKISNFLTCLIPEFIFNIKISTNKKCEGCPAYVDEKGIIWINKKTFYTYSLIEQKAILLHEAGHIVIGDLKTSSDTELYAHLWAMKTAKTNGWKLVFHELEEIIINWSNFTWNEDNGIWRHYITASKKYLRRKYEKTRIKSLIKVRNKASTMGPKIRNCIKSHWTMECRIQS